MAFNVAATITTSNYSIGTGKKKKRKNAVFPTFFVTITAACSNINKNKNKP